MTDQTTPVSPALARALTEFAGLPLGDDRLATISRALQDMLAGRAILDALDLSDYEPAAAFDPAWQ